MAASKKGKAAARRQRAKRRESDTTSAGVGLVPVPPAPTTATTGELVPASAAKALADMAEEHTLDGRYGSNRCRTRNNQLGVETDIEAIFAWVADRGASPQTKRQFFSEARRLCWWAIEKCPNPHSPRNVGKAISSLTRQDLVTYKEFLRKPTADAIALRRGKKKQPLKAPFLTRDGTLNPEWRPFLGPLSPAHVERVFLILKNMFAYMVEGGYLDGNPLGGMRAKEKASMGEHSKRAPKQQRRKLDNEQWLAVLEAIEQLPQETEEQKHYYERARWMMQLFFHLGARIGEVASHSMQWFIVRPAAKGQKEEWVWSVMGKGGKEEEVPMNDALIAALARYRLFLGVPALPFEGDKTPLVHAIPKFDKDVGPETGDESTASDKPKKAPDKVEIHAIGERQIARLVKEIFVRAADVLEPKNPLKAAQLRIASPHWIRHAMASFAAERAKDMKEILGVRDLMRHSDLATTLRYVHVADEAKKMISDWLAQASRET